MEDQLQKLTRVAGLLTEAEALVATKEEELKAAKAEVTRLSENVIPPIMEKLGIAELKMDDGAVVTVGEEMQGRQLTGKHVAALKWLRDNDLGGLIKTEVVVPFAAGSEGDADQLIERLQGEDIAASKGVVVNAASLKASIKRKLEEGVDVPVDTLGIHQKTVTKVKR